MSNLDKLNKLCKREPKHLAVDGETIWIYESDVKYADMIKSFNHRSETFDKELDQAILIGEIAAKIKAALGLQSPVTTLQIQSMIPSDDVDFVGFNNYLDITFMVDGVRVMFYRAGVPHDPYRNEYVSTSKEPWADDICNTLNERGFAGE